MNEKIKQEVKEKIELILETLNAENKGLEKDDIKLFLLKSLIDEARNEC